MLKTLSRTIGKIFNPVTELCDIREVGRSYADRYTVANEYYCATHDHSFSVSFLFTKPLLCDKSLGLSE